MEEASSGSRTGGFPWLPVVLAASLLAAVAVRIARSPARETEQRRTVEAMGTLATIIVVAPEGVSDSILDASAALLRRLDGDLDTRGTGSVGRLNRTGSCTPSPDLRRLYLLSLDLCEATGGAFDPSLAPLVHLWGFDSVPSLPDSSSIDSALALCGTGHISLADGRMRADPGSGLDLGAVAAGYAADRCYELAMGMGAEAFLVDVGGEIRCGGDRTWRIAVRHPRGEGFHSVIEMCGGAVSTSGDYESFFVQDGRRYSHLLDPMTGRPSDRTASVTVRADGAATADALSTAFAVAGEGCPVPDSLYRGAMFLLDGGGEGLVERRLGSLD